MSETKSKYWAKEFARDRWHVIGPSGQPLYDGALFGNDKPLVWTDEDKAHDYAERCNAESERCDRDEE